MHRDLWMRLVLISAATSAAGQASGQSLKEKFISAYSAHAARLERFYTNIDMTEEVSGTWAQYVYRGTVRIHWRSAGTKYRDDIYNTAGTIVKSRLALGGGNCRVEMAGLNTPGTTGTADKPSYALSEIVDEKMIES